MTKGSSLPSTGARSRPGSSTITTGRGSASKKAKTKCRAPFTIQAAAQKFLAFLVSKPAQELVSKLNITFEYPLVPGVAANPMLKPTSELQPPSLTLKQIGDDHDAAALLSEAGLI